MWVNILIITNIKETIFILYDILFQKILNDIRLAPTIHRSLYFYYAYIEMIDIFGYF